MSCQAYIPVPYGSRAVTTDKRTQARHKQKTYVRNQCGQTANRMNSSAISYENRESFETSPEPTGHQSLFSGLYNLFVFFFSSHSIEFCLNQGDQNL